MAEIGEISAWIAFFVGLYALAAGTGEIVVLAIGAAIYLVNSWVPGDWLSIAVSVIGGLAVAEGLLILAAGDRFLHLSRTLVGRYGRAWAGFAALFGIALVLVAMLRIQPL